MCSATQDRADGHVAGARHVGTQAVWLRDEGPGGAVDQVRRCGHQRNRRQVALIPASILMLSQLAAELRGAATVVLHCGKSVQRGPHAANRYEEARARLADAGDDALAAQRVVLLEGGFAAFAACPAAQGLLAAEKQAEKPQTK